MVVEQKIIKRKKEGDIKLDDNKKEEGKEVANVAKNNVTHEQLQQLAEHFNSKRNVKKN